MNKILYIVINKELKMSAGKAASQAVHAAMLLQENALSFANNYKRTVIVLEAENSEQIRNLEEYLESAGVFCMHYIDEGVNEVGPYSITALAAEPIDEDETEKREIFEQFNLFSGEYGSRQERALESLRSVSWVYQLQGDNTPRWLRRAIAKLEKL